MTTIEFPWRSVVQIGLELGGVAVSMMMSKLEGAQPAGTFLMGTHIIFIITVILGIALHYNSYTYEIAPQLRFIFAGLYVFCLFSTGIFFYFIVKISDPNVFDIILSTWGIMVFGIMMFYILRLCFFTYYAEELYGRIVGWTHYHSKETEMAKVEVQAEEKTNVPIYLMEYEKMFGKK